MRQDEPAPFRDRTATGDAGAALHISVALCTYNGHAYLAEQLASIAAQARLPDELIVCDDRSNDDTPRLLADFAACARFPVRVVVNSENLGSTANFAKAISLCQGDIIALSDQDDVWLPHKLDTVERHFHRNPDSGFVFSDATMVDQNRAPLGYTLWEAVAFGAAAQQQVAEGHAFEYLLRRYMVTGATLAFRSEYRDVLLPIPGTWVHDGWIALVISAFAPPSLIAEPLIEYRQHARQQIGEQRRGLYGQYLLARSMGLAYFRREFEAYFAAYERLSTATQPAVAPEKLAALHRKAEHCRQRLRMREETRLRRLPRIAGELPRYGRYSLGWKSLAQDLFL